MTGPFSLEPEANLGGLGVEEAQSSATPLRIRTDPAGVLAQFIQACKGARILVSLP